VGKGDAVGGEVEGREGCDIARYDDDMGMQGWRLSVMGGDTGGHALCSG
jgi:hypothetical protein